MNVIEYKTSEECYREALQELREASTEELQQLRRESGAYHHWFVRAVVETLRKRGVS